MSAMRLDDRHDRPLELAAMALDFDLTAAETAELEAHVATCSTCARRVAAMRADARALSRPLTLLPSARVDAAVATAIAHRRSGPQRVWLLAAAALLLLAMLGAVAVGAYLLQAWETLPTTDITPTQPVAEASPDPDGPPAVIGDAWEAIPFDDAAGGAIEAITFAGADLVGVGRGDCVVDSDGAGECHAAAWTAPAGGGWTRAPSQPGLAVGVGSTESDRQQGRYDVTSGPAGLVAIGYDVDPLPGSCPVAPCTSGPAVWRSPDGRTWERVQVDFGPAVIDTFSEPIAAITAGPDGYVMVGYGLGLSPAGDTEAHATAWASPDGVTWTRASDSEDLTLGGCVEADPRQDCGGMTAVAATPSGFVAVGYRYAGGSNRSPAAWTSPDGLTWTLTMAGLDFEGSLDSVAVGPAGIVAGGRACAAKNCYGTSAVLESDGTWTVSPATDQAMGFLHSLAATGDTYFGLADNGSALDLWRSEDGLAWQPVSGLPATPDGTAYMGVDLAAGSDRLVVVGWAADAGGNGFRNLSWASSPRVGAAPIASPSFVAPTITPAPTPNPSVEPTFSDGAGVASILVACEGLRFPSGALDGSVAVATPPAAAVEELAFELDIDPGLIASSGYLPVLVELDHVLFARSSPGGERPFEAIAFEPGPDGWRLDFGGGCLPRVVLDGTALAGSGVADWWLDPAAPVPVPADRELKVLVHELAPCITEPAGARVAAPIASYTEAAVTLTFGVAPLAGAPQECDSIGGPPVLSPYTVTLAEPIGDRALLDGGVFPPRDATRPPDS